jgi:hypothetical protein
MPRQGTQYGNVRDGWSVVLLTVPSCCRRVGSTSSLGGPHFSALFPEGKTEGSSVCHGLLTPQQLWVTIYIYIYRRRTFASLPR